MVLRHPNIFFPLVVFAMRQPVCKYVCVNFIRFFAAINFFLLHLVFLILHFSITNTITVMVVIFRSEELFYLRLFVVLYGFFLRPFFISSRVEAVILRCYSFMTIYALLLWIIFRNHTFVLQIMVNFFFK